MFLIWNTILFIALLGIGHDVTLTQVYGGQPTALVSIEVIVAYVLWLRMRSELRRLRLLNKAAAPASGEPALNA